MTSKTNQTQIKEEQFMSEEVKSKLFEFGNILLQGMVLATGSLIVNGVAENYRTNKQRKLVSKSSNVIDFNDKAANS
jgi:hypothetical protein